MQEDLGHGRRLSTREYERAIVALHAGASPAPDSTQVADISRREFDLTIDYRLGVAFPARRRERLWSIQQDIEARRASLALKWALRKLGSKLLPGKVTALANFVMEEYAKVLSASELRAYFGSPHDASPDDRA